MRDPEQLLIGRSMLRRRRMRRLLLARLLRERRRNEISDEQIGGADDEEGGDEEHRLLKLLIARGLLRRARIRRLLLAHLVREKRGATDEFEDEGEEVDDDVDEGEEGGDHRKFLRLIVGSGILRRRRIRNVLIAKLLKERAEAGSEDEDDYEDEDEGGEFAEGASDFEEGEGEGGERRVLRLLVGSRLLRRRRMRQALLAHLMKQREAA